MVIPEEVVAPVTESTVDDTASVVKLLLFAGIGKGAESCGGWPTLPVPVTICAAAFKECTSVKATIWALPSAFMAMSYSRRMKKGDCYGKSSLANVFESLMYCVRYAVCAYTMSSSCPSTASAFASPRCVLHAGTVPYGVGASQIRSTEAGYDVQD